MTTVPPATDSQKVEEVLLLWRTQVVEVVDHRVSLRVAEGAGNLGFADAVGGENVKQLG